jgi:hypothetical protein
MQAIPDTRVLFARSVSSPVPPVAGISPSPSSFLKAKMDDLPVRRASSPCGSPSPRWWEKRFVMVILWGASGVPSREDASDLLGGKGEIKILLHRSMATNNL